MTFSYGFDDENIKKNYRSHVCTMLLGVILARWRHPVASIEALESGDVRGYVPVHCHGHQNGHLCTCVCWLLFVCLLPWQPLGQYGASSCPMPASSGFHSSLGHLASGDVICITPAHLQGLQNWPQRRCILMSLLMLSSTISLAK